MAEDATTAAVDATDWDARPFFQTFGVRVALREPGRAWLEVDRTAIELRGVRNSINGGIVAALGQAATAVCLDTVLEAHERAGAAQELAVSYPSAARGARTLVEARLLRKGGRLAVLEAEVRDAGTGTINAKVVVAWTIERVPVFDQPDPAPDGSTTRP